MSSFKKLDNHLKPREKARLFGIETLSNQELLAIVIGSGSKNRNVLEISNELLLEFNGFSNFRNLDTSSYMKVEGIGIVKAQVIASVVELSKRIAIESEVKEKQKIANPEVIYKLCNDISDALQENVILISVNRKMELISKTKLYTGVLDSVSIHPREVFNKIIVDNAYGFILVHNHPSGNVEPSEEDIVMTKSLVQCANTFNVEFVDHIVITNQEYHSMRANNGVIFYKDTNI